MQRADLAEDEVNQVYNRAGSIYEQRLGLYGADHTAQETNGSDNMLYTTYFSSQAPLNPVPIGEHRLPPLPYDYDALEPYIDRETMRIHHLVLHQNYVDGLNRAEREMERARNENDYDLLRHWEREAAFNGAGHYLHTIFWFNMHPDGGGEPTGDLREQINRDFGSFERFKAHFSHAAEKVEGPGWALLVWAPRAHRLEILQAEKHHLLSQQDIIPVMALDVWEHAYFL
jgi:superoxide dismutase, Fe-Mn family